MKEERISELVVFAGPAYVERFVLAKLVTALTGVLQARQTKCETSNIVIVLILGASHACVE